MNYKLAKKLKDAGFPQDKSGGWWLLVDEKGNQVNVHFYG